MKTELFKEKSEFIATLELAFLRDNRSGVEDIAYIYKPEYDDEYIDVHFRGGGVKRIIATGNSNGDNAKEIIKAVYGE